jgi:hypothetical protein
MYVPGSGQPHVSLSPILLVNLTGTQELVLLEQETQPFAPHPSTAERAQPLWARSRPHNQLAIHDQNSFPILGESSCGVASGNKEDAQGGGAVATLGAVSRAMESGGAGGSGGAGSKDTVEGGGAQWREGEGGNWAAAARRGAHTGIIAAAPSALLLGQQHGRKPGAFDLPCKCWVTKGVLIAGISCHFL